MATLLGIDATKTAIRVALIRTSYRRIALEGLGEAEVLAHPTEADAVKAAVEALRPGYVGPPLRADASAIALGGERAFYRRLELPTAAQREIENVLAYELESTVPFEMSDAVFDYRMLKREPKATVLPIFAALARTDDVRERIQLVREAIGQEPERVGVGALPLANWGAVLPELERPSAIAGGPVAMLELGERTSDIVVIADGEPVFARTLSRGTVGLPESAPALVRELRQTLAAWRASDGALLSGMYLVGGGAVAQNAEQYLSTELGITVLPLRPAKLEGIRPEQVEMLPRFSKALGLALGLSGRGKSLNLRRGVLEAERSYPFLTEKIPLLAGLGAAIAVSFVFSVVAQMRSLDTDREVLEARLAAVSKDAFGEETTDPDKVRDLIEQGPGTEDDPMPRADAFDVMVQLSDAVPKDLVHDVVEFDVQRGHAMIQGTVPTIKDAETIADKMKEHRCMRDAKVTRNTTFGEGKLKYTLEFDIKCETAKKKKGTEPDASASASAGAKPDAKTEGKTP